MIRFVHVADLHFGVENYGQTDPKTGIHTRLLDFKASFDQCVEVAIAENVDFLLLCGDAYKTAHPTPTQQRLLLDSLLKLHHANIPVVIIVGNHDHPASFGKTHALDLYNQLPCKGFFVIEKPEIVTLKTKSGPINIVGIPWPQRGTLLLNSKGSSQARDIADEISKRVSAIIKHLSEQLDPTVPAVLAAHLTTSSGLFSGSERRAITGNDPIFMPSQLAISPFDYVALGHLHRHQYSQIDGVPVVYSGSIDRIDFGEKSEKKGFCIVSIPEKSPGKNGSTFSFIPLNTRPFIEIDVTLTNDVPYTEQIVEEIKKKITSDAVVKIIYRLPAGGTDRVDTKKIYQACSSAHYLASINPIRQQPQKIQRAHVALDCSIATALKTYCEARHITEDQQTRLEVLLEQISHDELHGNDAQINKSSATPLPPPPPSPHPFALDD